MNFKGESMIVCEEAIFRSSLLALYLIILPTYTSLRFIEAPYGKHGRPGWGPTMTPPLAWFLMESPALWLTIIVFPFGRHCTNPKSLILISPFLIHYFHRTCIYPLRLHRNATHRFAKPESGFPISLALVAFGFNFLNAYLQARWVSHYKKDYDGHGWSCLRYAGGFLIFVCGMWINISADNVLVGLKRAGGGAYEVPRGGLFEFVSCPNYLGEMVEWFGWAVMTSSLAGFGFFLCSCANLLPRASATHGWYLKKFAEDYPEGRNVVIPFIY